MIGPGEPYLEPGERVVVPRGQNPKQVSRQWIAREGIRGTVLGLNGIDNNNYVRVQWDDGRTDDVVPMWALRRLDVVERLAELGGPTP